MDYLEKVRLLVKLEAEQDPDDLKKPETIFVDVRYRTPQWEPGELEAILKDYSYVPETYKAFIEEFDSLGLLFVIFYGSKKVDCIPLKIEIAEFYEYLSDDYFPFAKDPAGGVFTIYKDGSIVFFLDYDYEFEKPERIADNFVDFIDNYVLGEKGCKELDPESYEFFETLNWR